MDNIGLQALLTIAGVIIAYAIVTNRLVTLTHRIRKRCTELLMEVILDERASADVVSLGKHMLDNLLDRRVAWRMALTFSLTVFRAKVLKKRKTEFPFTGHSELDHKLAFASILFAISNFALSPLAAVLMIAQLLVVAVLSASQRLLVGLLRESIGHNVATSSMWAKMNDRHQNHGHA